MLPDGPETPVRTAAVRRSLADALLGVGVALALVGLHRLVSMLAWAGLERGYWLPSHPLPATAANPAWWLLPAVAIGIALVCTFRRPRWWSAGALAASAAVVLPLAVGRASDVDGAIVAHNGPVAVRYARATQTLRTTVAGEVVSARGPDRDDEPLLAAIAHAWLRAGDRVRCIGAPAVAHSLRAGGRSVVEDVLAWPGQRALRFAGLLDGPVRPPRSEALELVERAPWAPLAAMRDGSRQLIAIAEWPTRATRFRASDRFQQQLRRVVGDGLVLQAIPLDGGDPRSHRELLASARRAHPWNGIFAVGDAAVLVSATAPPRWRSDFPAWSDEARWACHRAHLDGPQDLERAGREHVVDLAGREPSLLARWLHRRQRLASLREQLQALGDAAGDRRVARMMAEPWNASGARAAFLQAVRGLGADGAAVADDASLASRCAFAIDPTFFERVWPLFAALPRPLQAAGDLEDLSRVEVGERLARRCSGAGPLAVALRARFPSRCARSLVAQLAARPLAVAQRSALRELADPFVLAEAARVLVPDRRWRELLDLWRADVPLPDVLVGLAERGAHADRKQLAFSLVGRRDVGSCRAIAALLIADEIDLVVLASEALAIAGDGKIAFDPLWPRSKRAVAAGRLRGLHMRKP